MATQNPYSNSLLMDAVRGSLSNAESLGRGFAVAPVGLLGDVNALARQYVTPRLPQGVQSLLQSAPAAPTTEQILSNIPRVSNPRMETAGMEQLGAAMNPRGPVDLAKGVGRVAGNAINEAMVYDRGLLAGITPQPMGVMPKSIVREGKPIQSAVVLIGDRIFTGNTHTDAFNRAIYEGVIRKEGGKFIYPKDAEVNSDLFMTKDGQIIDRLQASKMFDIGASETAIAEGLMQNKPPSSMSVDSYVEQAKAIKQQKEKPSFTYPQEEAMRLAQQRAALPVEQGGLGLLSNNTAAEREAAMFPLKAYRGVTGDIESSVVPSDYFGSNYFGKGINLTTSPQDASKYASTDVGVNHDLVGKAELMSQKLGISYPEAKAELTKGGGAVMPISANIENPLIVGMQKIQAPESMIRYAINEAGYSGDVDKLVNKFKNANTGIEQFELMQANQATPFYRSMSSLMNKDGLMIDPSLSPRSEGGMHFLATDPDQIRSRFAAFDPFRRTAAVAAAMGVAAPDLLAEEQKPKKKKNLLD